MTGYSFSKLFLSAVLVAPVFASPVFADSTPTYTASPSAKVDLYSKPSTSSAKIRQPDTGPSTVYWLALMGLLLVWSGATAWKKS